jgi:threonine aldolase
MIDLRSDTVTQPTPEMRSAMAAAEVGDDCYGEDPTVNRLQERAAEIFKKDAGLFVPTGTMGNQTAIKVHTHHGEEVITESRSHVFNYELAAMAAFSGVLARPVTAPEGILSWDLIAPSVAPLKPHRARTGLITLENTHNMAGGSVYTAEQIDSICDKAHGVGIPVHLDGARIFNAATALGADVARLTRACDSVMFCFSKGLAAPVGSMLVGSVDFIERARRVRRMLGGGMRQSGVLAAAALVALEKMPARLAEDHRNARRLAELLSEIPGLDVRPEAVRTNILVVGISRTGLDGETLALRLKQRGVLVGAIDASTIRLLTHVNVSSEDIIKAVDAFRHVIVS